MTGPDNPFFSILIPVYNKQEEIGRCLTSVLGQTFKDIEVIAVDDASSDRSVHVLREFAEKDERIRIINKEKNESLLCARISGMQAAKGRYLLFVDADDFIDENTCKDLYDIIEKEPIDIIEFDIVNEPDKTCLSQLVKEELGNVYRADDPEGSKMKHIENMLSNRSLHNFCNKCCSAELIREFLDKTELFYCNMFEDMYFSVTLSYLADSYIRTDGKYYHYVRNSNGMTSDNDSVLDNMESIMNSINNMNNGLRSFFIKCGEPMDEMICGSKEWQIKDYVDICLNSNKTVYEKMKILHVIDSITGTDHAVRFEAPFEWYDDFMHASVYTKAGMLFSKFVGRFRKR